MTKEQVSEHFDLFYEDIFVELSLKYGEIEEMHICENIGDHLVGNVYTKFRYEDDAAKCMQSINNRFYGGELFSYVVPQQLVANYFHFNRFEYLLRCF